MSFSFKSLALAVTGLALSASTAGATQVTVDFDDLPANTELSTQYQGVGITDFSQTAAMESATSEGCVAPRVSNEHPGGAEPPSLPHWARFGKTGSQEFPDYVFCVRFADPQTEIQYRLSHGARLWYQRQNGAIVGPVSQSAGAKTLNYGGGASTTRIVGIHLEDQITNEPVWLDDLTYDSTAVPPPDWSAQPDPTAGVRAGSEAFQAIRVKHKFGDTTGTAFSIVPGTLPAGVSATINPASLPSGTTADQSVSVKLTAALDAVPGDFSYTVKIDPASGADRFLDVPAKVTAAIELQFAGKTARQSQNVEGFDAQAPTCDEITYSLNVRIPASASPDPGPVKIDVQGNNVPGGAIASGDGTKTVDVPADGTLVQLPRTITWAALGELSPQARLEAVAYYANAATPTFARIRSKLAVAQTKIDDVVELDPANDRTRPYVSAPRWDKQAGLLRIRGNRLCPGSMVLVGASAPAPLASISADHTEATVRIPRDATPSRGGGVKPLPPKADGAFLGLRVVAPNGVTTYGGAASFQLARASSLFAFKNAKTEKGITWKRWVEAYGSDQLELEVDPCGVMTFGLVDCTITKVPDPMQVLVWKIGYADFGKKGLCFGHVMVSDWLERGRLERAPLAAAGKSGGDNFSMADTPTPALQAEIERKFVLQAAPGYMLLNDNGQVKTFDALVKRLKDIFVAARDPWVSVWRSGKGHIVRATNIRLAGNKLTIETADSNLPFTADEASSVQKHKAAMDNSVIEVEKLSDGGYKFDLVSLEDFAGSTNIGGNGIRIVDPADVPTKFKSPLTAAGLLANAYIAASDGGDAQLVDEQGKPLPDVNVSPRLGGLGGLDGADLSVQSTRTVFLQQSRPGGQVVKRGGTLAALDGSVAPSARAAQAGAGQKLGLEGDGTALSPGGGTLAVANEKGAERRMVTVSGPVGTAVDVSAGGASVAVTGGSGNVALTLLRAGRRSSPPPLALPSVRLARGDRVTVPGKAFRARPGQVVELRLRRKGRTRSLRLRVKPGAKLVRSLTARVTRRRIAASSRFARLDELGTAVLGWRVVRSGRTIARGQSVAGDAAKTAGRMTLTVARALRRRDRVVVTAVARRGDGAGSAATRTVTVK